MQPLSDFLALINGATSGELDGVLRSSMQTLRSELPVALSGILKSVHAGTTETSSAKNSGRDALADAHARASYLGRRLAGNDSDYGDFDVEFGKLAADGQQPHFESFLADVESGRYTDDDGELRESALETRASFYDHALRGTANEAWTSSLDPQELIDWLLGEEDAANCTVCPSLAENGPYSPADMPTWPGANETPCLFNCRCTARTQSGVEGF